MKIRNHRKYEWWFRPAFDSKLEKNLYRFKYKADLMKFLNKNLKESVNGYFTVRADHHEAGIKCRNCNQGNPLGVFNKKNANNHKDKWLNIDAWLYFLEIFNGKDYFYKVGIVTKEDINNRLKEFPKHFQVNLLYFEKGNLYNHTYSETQIIEDFSMFQYNPKEDFRGKKECFSVNPLEYYYENFNITDENNEQQF